MQKVHDMRYTECAILWNIGILKVHFVHVSVRVHPRESMNKPKFQKNNVPVVDVDLNAYCRLDFL